MKKNLYVLLSAAAVVASMAAPASAMSLRFKFKVSSSGPSMYPCNAGLMNQSIGKQVCYLQNENGTKTFTDKNESCSTTEKNCNSRLVCMSPGGGEVYRGHFTANNQPWEDNSVMNNAPAIPVNVEAGIGRGQQMFTDADAYNHSISDLLFELTSEMYNSKYFVDICYRGGQQSSPSQYYNVFHSTNVGATNFVSVGETHGDNNRTGITMLPAGLATNYTNIAGLTVQTFTVCDQAGAGSYANGANSSGVYNTTDNGAIFKYAADGITPVGGGSGAIFQASSQTPIPGAGQDMMNFNFSNPRFCKTRYVFSETNAFSANPIFRNWTRGGAEVCTYTTFSEPLVSGSPTSGVVSGQ